MSKAGTNSAHKIYEQMRKETGRLAAYPLLGQTYPDPLLAAEVFRNLILTDAYVAIYKLIDDKARRIIFAVEISF